MCYKHLVITAELHFYSSIQGYPTCHYWSHMARWPEGYKWPNMAKMQQLDGMQIFLNKNHPGKGWVDVPFFPKIQALPGWGGVLTPAWNFWRICPHALRALKGDHFKSPTSDISPQKCSLIPRIDHSTTSTQHFHSQTWFRDVSPQKNGKMWEFWRRKKQGGVYPNLTSFVIWPRRFRHAKFIFRC